MVTKSTWEDILGVSKVVLGKQTSSGYVLDPKHLGFVLARYKFVAKLAAAQGAKKAVEIGCGDGFPTPVVAQSVDSIQAVDLEPRTLEHRARNPEWDSKINFFVHDVLQSPVPGGPFDLAYSIDVIEHIPSDLEDVYFRNIIASMAHRSFAVIGTPNKTSEQYASKHSRESHINLKTHASLRDSMHKHFDYVFMFGINDEVVHLGYGEMCHYLMAVGLNPKKKV